MLKRSRLFLCSSCGCHVLEASAACPGCGLPTARGISLPRVALAAGFGAVALAGGVACETQEAGSGGYGAYGDYGDYPEAVSTYGVGPSMSSSVTSVGSSGSESTGPASTVTASSSSTGYDECPAFAESEPCGQCMTAACCDEGTACFEASSCDEVMTCIDGCGADDLVCALACEAANPAGFALYQALVQCSATHCDGCYAPTD